MLTRISNIASVPEIELALNAKFDHNFLYAPKAVINGLKESSMAIITTNAPRRIQFGIWGILPENYEDSWKPFQATYNSLNTEKETLKHSLWLRDALLHRRCLVIATGFFISILNNHSLYPYYVSAKHQNIFCFAGIYNILADGFITFSILTHTATHTENSMETSIPAIIKEEHYSGFLGKDFSFDTLMSKELEVDETDLITYQVSKEVFKNKKHSLDVLLPQFNPCY
ncbi:SOS response-associated peptidase family protein [Mariniflexile sp.]